MLKTHPLRHQTPETGQPVRLGEVQCLSPGRSAYAPAQLVERGHLGLLGTGDQGEPLGVPLGAWGLWGERRWALQPRPSSLAAPGSAWTERPLCIVPPHPTQ